MKTNTPNMNIQTQINHALNDIRQTLNDLATWAKTPDISDQLTARTKAQYQLDLAMAMIGSHRHGVMSQPWSELSPQVDEEFS